MKSKIFGRREMHVVHMNAAIVVAVFIVAVLLLRLMGWCFCASSVSFC